jgi:hypothetical protein
MLMQAARSSTGYTLAVAAYGLAGSQLRLPDEPLPDDAWKRLVAEVHHQRLPGFLAQAVGDGAFAVTQAQAHEAAQLHCRSMHLALFLERLLLEVVGDLRDHGIDCRVLKGPALARLDYPDPSLRSFGDVDILVPADQYDAACERLAARGATRRFPEPRPGFDRRFGKGAAFVSDAGLEIDLHRTLVLGPFGLRVRLEDLFARSTPFVVGGHTLLALDAEERFLHACLHAALGTSPPRLLPLRDVAQLLLSGKGDPEALLRRCASWGAQAVVALAVQLAWDAFALADVVELSAWARAYQPTRAERSALDLYTTTRRTYSAQAAAALSAVPGLLAKGAYLRALLFPDPGYLDGRDGGYLRRCRRAAGLFFTGGAG